jgi:hypothetical protein
MKLAFRAGALSFQPKELVMKCSKKKLGRDRKQRNQFNETIEFLHKLRPGGPWELIAIPPDEDGPTITLLTSDEEAARAFIIEHNGKRNLFFRPNLIRSIDTSGETLN